MRVVTVMQMPCHLSVRALQAGANGLEGVIVATISARAEVFAVSDLADLASSCESALQSGHSRND